MIHSQHWLSNLVVALSRTSAGQTSSLISIILFSFVLFMIYEALLQVRVVQHRLLLEFLVRCNPLRLGGTGVLYANDYFVSCHTTQQRC